MWLPQPPFVEKPRAVHNAASLAYLGDVIYEVHAFIQSLLLLFLLSLSYLQENLGSIMVFGRN
jgi:23S rRNA maturation mini-RNase III